jgi:hypothetical protein
MPCVFLLCSGVAFQPAHCIVSLRNLPAFAFFAVNKKHTHQTFISMHILFYVILLRIYTIEKQRNIMQCIERLWLFNRKAKLKFLPSQAK